MVASDKILLVDCDEVILGWTEAFKKHAEKKLGRELSKIQDQFELHYWLEIPEEDAIEMIYDFNDNHPEFQTLNPLLKSEVYLPKLHEAGYTISVITACSDRESTAEKRKINLKQVFGDIFYNIHCVQNSEDKLKYLQSYPESIWVEDRTPNAVLGFRCGHSSIMIRHPHNAIDEELHPELIWVDDWEQIYNLLTVKENSVK